MERAGTGRRYPGRGDFVNAGLIRGVQKQVDFPFPLAPATALRQNSGMTSDDAPAIDAGFRKMNLPEARKHIFLCVGPDCCATEEGLAVWEFLKQAVKSEGLAVLRTKAACLRVCSGGPWMLVYPEGLWYGEVTVQRCERIVREHFVKGTPVAEWVVRHHPLEGGDGFSSRR